MPTYEYRCGACGHTFERLQKFSDDPVRTCPECGEDEVERLISSGAGLLFKGSGFYATDYRKEDGGKERREEGSKEGSEKGSKEGSKEASGEGKGGEGPAGSGSETSGSDDG